MQLVKTFSGSNVGLDGKLAEATATVVSPSAPSDLLDTTTTSAPAAVAHAASAPSQFEMEPIAMAEAQALPPDWNAQTAQVVEIPMAEAMVIEPSAPPMFK